MQVSITYHDDQSLTMEEVVAQAVHNYGRLAEVKVMPDSTLPHDLIHFGIQQVITHEQLSLLFDKGCNYQKDIKKLRAEVLYKITEIVDQVIIENEAKLE